MLKLKSILIAGLLMSAPAVAVAQDSGAEPSEAGAALFRDYQANQRAELTPLYKRRAELQAQFDVLMKPEGYDDAKLAETMSAMREVEGQIVEKQGLALLALLRSMSDSDRTIFLNSMSKTPQVAARPDAPTPRPETPPESGVGR